MRNLQVDDVGTDERKNRHENLRHVMHRVFEAEVVLHEVKLGVPRVEETATGGGPERNLCSGGNRHERPAVQKRQAENRRSPDPELRHLIRGGVEVIGDHLRRDQEHLEGINTKGDGRRLDELRFGHALRRRRRRHSLGCDLRHFARFSLQRKIHTRQSFGFIFTDSSRTLTGAILCTDCELAVDFGTIILFVVSRFVTRARSAGRAVIVVDARVNMLI